MRTRLRSIVLLSLSLCLVAATAAAHVSVTGPGIAGSSQILTFNVAHGCSGADTVALEVMIPSEIFSVRAMPNVFGKVTVHKDDADVVTSVEWTKDDADVHDVDELYYQLALRVGIPDAPFTSLMFTAKQTCRDAEGTETVVNWAATPEEIENAPAGEEPEPAAVLMIVPPRAPGWNRYEASAKITDLSVFDDAQIVWVGDAAYSANPATMEMIESEDDVTVLTEIKAGAEIWVKY